MFDLFGLFKSKNKEEQLKDDMIVTAEILQENLDVLNGACPWRIYEKDLGSDNPWGKHRKVAYTVAVYLIDKGDWYYLHKCSEEVIGIKRKEFKLMVTEHFNGVLIDKDYDNWWPAWLDPDEVKEVINKISKYYDEFYLPRAVMNRLMGYVEGGYPPYFQDHPIAQKIINHQIELPREEEDDEELTNYI